MISKIDEKGRLYLPKKIRRGLKGKVYVVRMGNEVVIIPIPEDPVSELAEIGRKLPDKPVREFRKEIERAALEEIT